jgi:hypothetical protein
MHALSTVEYPCKIHEEPNHAPNAKDMADLGNITYFLFQLVFPSLPGTDQPLATHGYRRGGKGNEFKGPFRW